MQYLEAEKAIATTYYKDLFKRLSEKYGYLEETSRKIKVVRRVSEFATTVEEKTLLELVVEGHLDHVKSNIFLRLVYDLWGGVQRYITEKALDLLLDIVDWNNLVDLDGNDLITIGEVFDDKTIKSAVCEIMADKAVDYCLTTSAGIGRIIGEVLIQKYSMFDGDLLDDYAFAYNDPQKLKEDLRYIMDLEEKLTSIPENERIAIERDLTMFFLDQDVFRVGINNIVEFLKTHLLERMDPDDDAPRSPSPEIRQDPLILDLNRDGKVSTTAGKRYFDMDANGVAERVSWAASGDGFLAMDRDGDGKITSGRELFGDHTVMSDGRMATSGFQALADLDSNKDGKIDASDEAFGRLRIWSDKDGNGKFEDHELSTLEEAGIESIDLRYSDHRTEDENGNQIVRTGRFTWKDGDRGKVSEFLLERDTIHSLVGEQLEEPDEVAALPDLPQRGFLYSLHQAMVRDGSGELRKLTERFAGEKDSVARRSLLERIMLKWSEVSNVESVPYDGWLGFMKKFYGNKRSYGNPSAEGWRELRRNYEEISLYLYGDLLCQSHYEEKIGRAHV